MTDEEAMEALLNSDGYSFPTWTLKLGLPTDEMRLVMSLIASDKAPIPVDVAYISEYLHMDGAVVESSVKSFLIAGSFTRRIHILFLIWRCAIISLMPSPQSGRLR